MNQSGVPKMLSAFRKGTLCHHEQRNLVSKLQVFENDTTLQVQLASFRAHRCVSLFHSLNLFLLCAIAFALTQAQTRVFSTPAFLMHSLLLLVTDKRAFVCRCAVRSSLPGPAHCRDWAISGSSDLLILASVPALS